MLFSVPVYSENTALRPNWLLILREVCLLGWGSPVFIPLLCLFKFNSGLEFVYNLMPNLILPVFALRMSVAK